jgi:hypothetical protein
MHRTSFGTPVLIDMRGVARVGGAGDFHNPMDTDSMPFTMGIGLSAGFVYALVARRTLGVSIEPGIDTLYGATDFALGHWKSPVPWEDRTHADGWIAVHVATHVASDRRLGIDVRWTPFVVASGPYDDVDQFRFAAHVDFAKVSLRGEYAYGAVKGSDPKTGTLDGHESITSVAIVARF